MSEKLKTSTAERPLRRLRNKARKAAALTAMVGVSGGTLAPMAHAEPLQNGRAKIERVQQKLKNPSELPGIKIHLGVERLNELKAATVELGIRMRPDLLPPGTPDEPFQPFCTAVKVSVDGDPQSEVATAGHCMRDLTGAKHGAFTDTQNPLVKAENFTALSQYQFAILDPNEPDSEARKVRPVAIVDQISVSTDDKDTSLLRVSPVTYADTSPTIRTWDQIPALPYRALKHKPVPGTPVAMYGVPAASGFLPVATTGTYLGRYVEYFYDDSIKQNVTRYLDIVGVNTLAVKDPCNYGASGSVIEFPDGEISGNLAQRDNLGYDPGHYMQPDDGSLQDNIRWVTEKEQQLGVKIRGNFNTVCGYTVVGKQTPQQMVLGYGIPAPGEGADPGGGKG